MLISDPADATVNELGPYDGGPRVILRKVERQSLLGATLAILEGSVSGWWLCAGRFWAALELHC